MQVELDSVEDTIRIAERLGKQVLAGDVIALIGPLGAGKTVFAKGLSRGMGVGSEFEVTSPTFVYAHVYDGKTPLYHLDLYRIENEKHLAETGIEEMLGGEGVAAIEWFDLFPRIWASDRLEIRFEMSGSTGRKLSGEGFGDRGRALLKRWSEAR
ncbi:MAG: tRNA (adenosine(37)-N6)-threonylcarbamoyltransferase complex ATPase subunit type 1 TsaE [Pseudomonadota bacterium]